MADVAGKIEIGGCKLASGWLVESSLPVEDRANLLAFVCHFPSLLFYRHRAARYDGADHFYTLLPQWLKAIPMTLAWVYADGGADFQLDDEQNRYAFFLYADEIDAAFVGISWDLAKDSLFFLPIAGSLDDLGEVLAVNYGDEADHRIYRFHEESLADYRLHGFPLRDVFSPAYDSYSAMLAHISQIHLRADGARGQIAARVC